MKDEQGFLAALAASPEDDTTRLVYADWLDEQDDPRGRYLRAEVELGKIAESEMRYAELEAELRKLREGIDPAWLAQAGQRYDVVLRAYLPVEKITLIYIIRELTNLGLKESKDLIEAVPTAVLSKRSRQEAEHARDALRDRRGPFATEVEVVRSDKVREALLRRPMGADRLFDVYLCSLERKQVVGSIFRDLAGTDWTLYAEYAVSDATVVTALHELTGMDRQDCASLLARPLPALVLAGVSAERAKQACQQLFMVAAAGAEVRFR